MPARAPRSLPLILVVDDGELHVTLLRLALSQRGYAVIVAHSVDGARTMLRDNVVDALLITSELSAAVDVVRELGEARPAIALAFAPEVEGGAERTLAAGFDIALARPIDFAELDDLLRDRLKKRASGTRARARLRGRTRLNAGR